MNCKPGDMAIVVQGTNIGVIVEVISVSDYYGWPYWRVHTAWPTRAWYPDGSPVMVTIASIHDARLQPIRPNTEPSVATLPAAPVVEEIA
jgi:hypothetical protein